MEVGRWKLAKFDAHNMSISRHYSECCKHQTKWHPDSKTSYTHQSKLATADHL